MSDNESYLSRDSGGPDDGASVIALGQALLARGAESRDQLIARRRAAQQTWRAAREGAERAALGLHEASRPCGTALTVARRRLERAEHGERQARHSYQQVAEETGALLSRLAHSAGRA